MGLLSFVKNAGAKLFGGDDANDKKEEAIKNHLEQYNLLSSGASATVDGSVVTLSGSVDNPITKARIVTTVGNIDGVESVEDNISVTMPPQAAEETATEEPEVRYYEVKSGDTLSKIAEEMYGDATQYPKIFEANRPMLDDPDKIYPGQKLVIPS